MLDESENCETSLKPFSTKEAYSSILDKSFSAPTAEGRILYHGYTNEEIPYIYMLPFKPKLIMFQVKIIHNILPTQSRLSRARIADTDVCPLCNLGRQSLKHMLITCSVSSSFWTCFSNWWHEKFNHKPPLSESTILYRWHPQLTIKNNDARLILRKNLTGQRHDRVQTKSQELQTVDSCWVSSARCSKL